MYGALAANPIASIAIGGKGKNGGWFGWVEDARIEQLKDTFARSQSPEEQKKIAADIQKEVYDQVLLIPLGQFLQPSAWRKSLTGVLGGPATPVFWNIEDGVNNDALAPRAVYDRPLRRFFCHCYIKSVSWSCHRPPEDQSC